MSAAEVEPELCIFEQFERPIVGFKEVPDLWLVSTGILTRAEEPAKTDLEHYQEVMVVLVNGLRYYSFEAVKPRVQCLHNRLEDPIQRATLATGWLMAAQRQNKTPGPLVDRPPLYTV